MNDATPPQRKVVRRVVKKTVVRPTSSAATAARRPAVTRPAASPITPAAREVTPRDDDASPGTIAVAEPRVTATPRVADPAPVRRPRRRPTLTDSVSVVRDGVAETGLWFADRFHDVVDWSADRFDDAADRVHAWEVPPARIAALTGVSAGLLAVALGALALTISSSVRDRTAGGGWGLLTFVLLCAVTVFLSGRALRAFGVGSGGIVALLGTLLAVAAMLVFFVDAGQSVWMVLVIPLLMAVTYPASLWLIETAQSESDPTPV